MWCTYGEYQVKENVGYALVITKTKITQWSLDNLQKIFVAKLFFGK